MVILKEKSFAYRASFNVLLLVLILYPAHSNWFKSWSRLWKIRKNSTKNNMIHLIYETYSNVSIWALTDALAMIILSTAEETFWDGELLDEDENILRGVCSPELCGVWLLSELQLRSGKLKKLPAAILVGIFRTSLPKINK